MSGRSCFTIALVGWSVAAVGQSPTGVKVGDAYEITLDRQSVGDGPEGASRTTDRDAIVERVAAVRGDGVEITADLPPDTPAEARASQWQLPARIMRPLIGPSRLLNRADLEARLDRWLKSGEMTRAMCGHLIFTWNVFRIECDPDSALGIVAAFDALPDELRDGAPFRDPRATGTARLVRTAAAATGATFTAELPIDADAIRRERAEADVGLGEISGKPVSLDAALHAHAADKVTGTIKATFDADATGQVRRRTRTIRFTVTSPGREAQTQTMTESLERKRLS